MRTLVDIPDDDLANKVVKAQSISRAEFIRRAIAQSLTAHRKTQIEKARKRRSGCWLDALWMGWSIR